MRYIGGGWIYFWSGYAIFAICYSGFHWDWLWAKMLADVVGWSLNYFAQRFWAFADHISFSEMKHAGRYIGVETMCLVMDYGIIGGLKWIGITPYIGFFISSGFFTFYRYMWYKFYVFPESNTASVKAKA